MDKIYITDQLKNCHRLTKFELEQLCHEALNEIKSLRAEIDKLNHEMNVVTKSRTMCSANYQVLKGKK
jgi:hypothetical protein